MGQKQQDNLSLDSKEELYLNWYLEELKQAEFIREYTLDPSSYTLSEKVSVEVVVEKQLKTKLKQETKSKTLLNQHVYTPDAEVIWTSKALGVFIGTTENYLLKKRPFYHDLYKSVIEVKPTWNMQNMKRLFSLNQKWMLKEHGIYVQMVIPELLFRDTFTPQRFLLTDKGTRERAIRWEVRTLNDYYGQFKE